MKKILSAAIALCLVLLTFPALAELVTGSEPLETDAFILDLGSGIPYSSSEGDSGATLYSFFPYANSGDSSTNFNIQALGVTGKITVNDVLQMADQLKEQIVTGYESFGITIKSVNIADPIEESFHGVSSIRIDISSLFEYSGIEIGMVQSLMMLPDKGVLITLTGETDEILSALYSLVDASITLK